MHNGREWVVEAAGGLLLLGALAIQLGIALAADGLTNDELLYVPAGYRSLTDGDYRLDATSPPLAKMVAAAGLLRFPVRLPSARPGETTLDWCYRFFHEANDAAALLRRARLGAVLLTLGLALLAWRWARSVAGVTAGLIALTLIAFHTSLLAHGHLATTDLPSAFTFLLTSWAFWRWTRGPSLRHALLVGVALGLAVDTRLTGVLLVPALALAALLDERGRRIPFRAYALLATSAAVAVPLVIWASYGFRFSAGPGPPSLVTTAPVGLAGLLADWMASHRLLPEAYLEGVRFQANHTSGGHLGYLLGERARTGWRSYYLIAFLVKNTPGFLLAVAATLLLWRKIADEPERAAVRGHWLFPALVLSMAVSMGKIQIGERYLLPCYPYLALLSGVALSRVWSSARGKWVVAGVLTLHVGPTLAVQPRGYLPYFNALAGGPSGGHRILLDSNLDWGQDLPRLAAWMRTSGVPRVQLAYFGADSPGRVGIDHEDLPGLAFYPPQPPTQPFRGVVAISPNLLFGLVPRLGDPYAFLRDRPPDDRAGIFFVYRFP